MSEPEGRASLTDKLDADVRAALGRIGRVPQLLVACDCLCGWPRRRSHRHGRRLCGLPEPDNTLIGTLSQRLDLSQRLVPYGFLANP